MSYLLLSILFSVLLLINFRLFPKFNISTFQAIAFNYLVCFLTGYVLMPENQSFVLDFSQEWTYYAALLGVGFILTFLLSGASTQKIGMTLTSLANNISLVIPVLCSLFLFGSSSKVFDVLNYLGLLMALLAVVLSTYQPAKQDKKSTENRLHWLLPIGVFLMYGITNTAINYLNIKYIQSADKTIPVTLVMVLGAAISGIIVLIMKYVKKDEIFAIKNVLAGFTLGIPNFLSFYFLILALTSYGNSGAFVYPIYNIGVIILTAVVALVFFKERLTSLNKYGLLLAILAIIFISFSWQDLQSFFGK